MKHYILPQNGNFYRANLHCHSTLSDGKLTPEELKQIYKSAGYSILAYSDHNVLIDHSDLNDENFLALTSTEIDVTEKGDQPWAFRSTYHINFFPPHPHDVTLPCFNPKYIRENHADLRESQAYFGTPNFTRDYNHVNEMVAEYRKHGFIAMLNHPTWSLQDMDDYETLDFSQFFAMEMYNHSCYVAGYDEINSHLYDEILQRGNRVYCTATDDNHNAHPLGTQRWDSLGGFVMIKANELTHEAIVKALQNGHFYASTGPLIEELYVEDDRVFIKTSPASKIVLSTGVREIKIAYPTSPHGYLYETEFDISKLQSDRFRITVTDERGRMAWSQPYYKQTDI